MHVYKSKYRHNSQLRGCGTLKKLTLFEWHARNLTNRYQSYSLPFASFSCIGIHNMPLLIISYFCITYYTASSTIFTFTFDVISLLALVFSHPFNTEQNTVRPSSLSGCF